MGFRVGGGETEADVSTEPFFQESPRQTKPKTGAKTCEATNLLQAPKPRKIKIREK